jgi:hypothetical protein
VFSAPYVASDIRNGIRVIDFNDEGITDLLLLDGGSGVRFDCATGRRWCRKSASRRCGLQSLALPGSSAKLLCSGDRLPAASDGAGRGVVHVAPLCPPARASCGSAAELDRLVLDIEKHIAHPDTWLITFTTIQVWG